MTIWTPSPNFGERRGGERPDMLVMHYTASPQWRSLDVLTSPAAQVSSHYLVSDDPAGTIFQLVDEDKRAWHAGRGSWGGLEDVNSRSIGVENVGWGYTYGPLLPLPPCPSLRRPVEVAAAAQRRLFEAARARGLPTPARVWQPFPPAQVAALTTLSREIVARWGIPRERVVAHADVAPGRKLDPGPRFPWRSLALAGVGDWPGLMAAPAQEILPAGASVGWMQRRLEDWGYAAPQNAMLDAPTRAVVSAFQMHYRPRRCDGQVDVESMAALQQLLAQRAQRARGLEAELPSTTRQSATVPTARRCDVG